MMKLDKFDKIVKLYERYLSGGVADGMTPEDIAEKHGVPVEKIYQQLDIGTSVEFEHTDNEAIAREIAMDHLEEIPNYYDRLDKMEKEAKGSLEENMTAGSVMGDITGTGGSFGNTDSYAPGDARLPYSIYGGVLTRKGKIGAKKKKKKNKKKDK